MSAALAATVGGAAAQDPIRVMVVDDSVVVRGLVTRWLQEQPDMQVVASARTGREAVDKIERVDPDVVILDIEMPELDGLSALPLLLEKKRDLVVIMASALTRRHAEVSFKALSLGAADYIPKPESNHGITTSPAFRNGLIEKVRHIGGRRAERVRGKAASPPRAPLARPISVLDPRKEQAEAPAGAVRPGFALRAGATKAPKVLLIGASTGGPQALGQLAPHLGPVAERAPILIVQHMPATFTTIFAEHLSRASGHPAREPDDGEPIVAGTIYLAPGGRHMQVARQNGLPVIRLDDGPAVNFCKPAVDSLFASACQVWDGAMLAVILTGMGHDGTEGARAIVAAGGTVIAQDETTSIVWGMPGSAANAGLCAAVLPLDQIASKVIRRFSGEVA